MTAFVPATSPHVMNTYARVPIALERGQGVRAGCERQAVPGRPGAASP